MQQIRDLLLNLIEFFILPAFLIVACKGELVAGILFKISHWLKKKKLTKA